MKDQSLKARIRWRMQCLRRRINGVLVRLGPRVFIQCHWPWLLRKPWMRPELTIQPLGGGLGDELMCLPIFAEIKRRNPRCRISFVTRRPDFFRGQENVDEVLTEAPGRRVLMLVYNDLLPPPRPLMSLMGECAGLTGTFPRIPPPSVTPSAATRKMLDALPRPLVVVQPVASGWTTNKNWPLASWKECARRLAAVCQVMEVGVESVLPAEEIGEGFCSMAGRTSLEDFAYMISQADLFIGPSSSGIFGGYEAPSGYDFPNVHPLYSPVPCAPCWRQTCPYELKCLHAIQPATVLEQAWQILGISAPPGAET
jgi:ADP-heptose:LPS heptosyltransferase